MKKTLITIVALSAFLLASDEYVIMPDDCPTKTVLEHEHVKIVTACHDIYIFVLKDGEVLSVDMMTGKTGKARSLYLRPKKVKK